MNSADKKSLASIPIVLLIGSGIAIVGGLESVKILGFPLFSLCIGSVFLIQWIAFIPAYYNKTEKFYDLTGSITYITVTITAVIFSLSLDLRTILLLCMILLWAARLGSFLFSRIRADGEDKRFRMIKISFTQFLLAWTLQGLWVSFSLAAALAAITSSTKIESGLIAILGFAVWLIGFGIEMIADRQKSQFRGEPENKGRFINSGLWSWSRHPNYFGETILWIGLPSLLCLT